MTALILISERDSAAKTLEEPIARATREVATTCLNICVTCLNVLRTWHSSPSVLSRNFLVTGCRCVESLVTDKIAWLSCEVAELSKRGEVLRSCIIVNIVKVTLLRSFMPSALKGVSYVKSFCCFRF